MVRIKIRNLAMRIILAFFLLMLTAPFAFAQSHNKMDPIPVDDSFWIDKVKLTSGRAILEFALRARPTEDGELVLCAAVRHISSNPSFNQSTAKAMEFRLNGRRVVRSLGWAGVSKKSGQITGTPAVCRHYPKVELPEGAKWGYSFSTRRPS